MNGCRAVTDAETADASGAVMGGAARLLRRELSSPARSRRIALKNAGFDTRERRWTLLPGPLHFLAS
jgi:hypothetical protein